MGRAVAPGEPRWTEEDTVLAVEWQRLQAETCGGCGQPLTDSMDEASDWDLHKLQCFACETKEKAEAAAEKPIPGRKLSVTYAGRRPVQPD